MDQQRATVEAVRRLTVGERVIAVAATLLLVDSVLPWYIFDLPAGLGSYHRNAWGEPNALYSTLAVVLAIALGGLVIGQAASESERLREILGPVAWGVVYTVMGLAAFLLIAAKAVANLDLDATYGLFLGALCALGLVLGGYIHARDALRVATSPRVPRDRLTR